MQPAPGGAAGMMQELAKVMAMGAAGGGTMRPGGVGAAGGATGSSGRHRRRGTGFFAYVRFCLSLHWNEPKPQHLSEMK